MLSSSASRSQTKDELPTFIKQDNLNYFEELCINIKHHKFEFDVIHYMVSDCLLLQSKERSQCDCSCIPKFALKIMPKMKYERYNFGIQCQINSLTKNRIHIINAWSCIVEALRFLNNLEIDQKKRVLMQQVEVMSRKNSSNIFEQQYPPEVVIHAFEYFATSRSLYQQLRNDFQLPSIATLTRVTSKVSNIDDKSFINSIFQSFQGGKKLCILLTDKVYVKPLLSYGEQLFGNSVNNPSKLAKTVLSLCWFFYLGDQHF